MSFGLATITSPSPVLIRTRLGMLAQAKQIYVNSSGNDAGQGTPASPLRSISRAFSSAKPGDSILLSGNFSESVTTSLSGQAGGLISILPAPGQSPTWKGIATSPSSLVGALNIAGGSFLVIKGIRFDSSVSRAAVVMTDSNNIEFSQNLVVRNGNNGINADEATRVVYLTRCSKVKISQNQFDGNFGTNIWLIGSTYNEILDNLSINTRGSHSGFEGSNYFDAKFLQIGSGSNSNLVQGNEVSRQFSESYSGSHFFGSGVKLDSGSSSNSLRSNLVHDIDSSRVGRSAGFYNESGCNNNVFEKNTVYNIGEAGLREGSAATNAPIGLQWIGNSVYKCGIGFLSVNAKQSTVKNNNFWDNQIQVYVLSQSATGGHIFRSNNYFKSGSTLISKWGGTVFIPVPAPDLTFIQWSAKSGDQGSTNVDPHLVPSPPVLTVAQDQQASPAATQTTQSQPSSGIVPIAVAGAVALLLLTLGD